MQPSKGTIAFMLSPCRLHHPQSLAQPTLPQRVPDCASALDVAKLVYSLSLLHVHYDKRLCLDLLCAHLRFVVSSIWRKSPYHQLPEYVLLFALSTYQLSFNLYPRQIWTPRRHNYWYNNHSCWTLDALSDKQLFLVRHCWSDTSRNRPAFHV